MPTSDRTAGAPMPSTSLPLRRTRSMYVLTPMGAGQHYLDAQARRFTEEREGNETPRQTHVSLSFAHGADDLGGEPVDRCVRQCVQLVEASGGLGDARVGLDVVGHLGRNDEGDFDERGRNGHVLELQSERRCEL